MVEGTLEENARPTEDISVRDVFGIDSDMKVKGFADRTSRVPELDSTYKFDPDTTMAILAESAQTCKPAPFPRQTHVATAANTPIEIANALIKFIVSPSLFTPLLWGQTKR